LHATSHDTRNPVSGPPTRGRVVSARTRPNGSRRESTAPPALRRPPLRREVSPYAYAGVRCWWSADRWLTHVTRVYRRSYLIVRPRLVATSGGGVSLATVLAVAATQAADADHRTGRGSRPAVARMMIAAGRGERTVQRAREFLRLTGLATEIEAGRRRSYTERIASWARGDTARGWTAGYALHPSPTYPDDLIPVDNSPRIIAGQQGYGTPPRSGISTPTRSVEKRVSTTDTTQAPPAGGEDGAPRRASTTPAAPSGAGGDLRAPATALMLAWRGEPDCPGWAKRFGAHRWAGALSAPAAAGWTARDLTQLLTDLTGVGHHILREPHRPIGYLLALLAHVDLAERPTALIDAHAAADRAQRAERTAAQHAARTEADRARRTAIEALTGPGRAAAHHIAATAVALAAQHRRERQRVQLLAPAEQQVNRRRRDD